MRKLKFILLGILIGLTEILEWSALLLTPWRLDENLQIKGGLRFASRLSLVQMGMLFGFDEKEKNSA